MVFSGQSKKNALHWAQEHLPVQLGMADAFLSVGNAGKGVPGGARNPEPAQPFTSFHLEKLEQFACSADTPPEMVHITAGLVFRILCCLRICQPQDSWITGIKAGRFIQGVVFKDINPNPTKQCSRPFFGVLFGLCGRGWFDTWWTRASKQVVGRFVFEDYRVNSNGVVE
jgi:hypothetical protein